MPSSGKEIGQAIQPFIDRQEVAGAVLLVANAKGILYHEAFGYADVSTSRPMTPDALFWIASQTKPITATGLMVLVDEGKVSIEDPVEKYLPEFHGQWLIAERSDSQMVLRQPQHPITVQNVLQHTSGLPFASALDQGKIDRHRLADRVVSYAMTPLQNPPDAVYEYSNAGTNTVGRIIEVVSEIPYEQFIQDRLLDPLGMSDTTFWPEGVQLSRLAKSYKPGTDNRGFVETPIGQFQYPLDDRRNRYACPAGGLFSTAADIARFCRMTLNEGILDDHRYVSPEAVRRMTRKQPGACIEYYGLAWGVGDGWCGHGGAYSTNMAVDFNRGLVMVYLVQHEGFPGDGGRSGEVFQEAAKAAFGS